MKRVYKGIHNFLNRELIMTIDIDSQLEKPYQTEVWLDGERHISTIDDNHCTINNTSYQIREFVKSHEHFLVGTEVPRLINYCCSCIFPLKFFVVSHPYSVD